MAMTTQNDNTKVIPSLKYHGETPIAKQDLKRKCLELSPFEENQEEQHMMTKIESTIKESVDSAFQNAMPKTNSSLDAVMQETIRAIVEEIATKSKNEILSQTKDDLGKVEPKYTEIIFGIRTLGKLQSPRQHSYRRFAGTNCDIQYWETCI